MASPLESLEMGRPWQEVVAAKRSVREALIRDHWQSDKAALVEEITEIDDICDLTQRLDAGKFTAEDIVRACIEQSVNCMETPLS